MIDKKINKKNFLNYINQIAEKYSFTNEKVSEFLQDAFKNNFLKEYSDNSIGIKIDLSKGNILMWRNLEVVTDDFYYGKGLEDDEIIVTLSAAKSIPGYSTSKLKIGDMVKKPIEIEDFDLRLVKNIMSHFQKLTIEEMNKQVYYDWLKYKGQVLEGVVEKIIENKDQTPKEIIVSLIGENGMTTKAVILKYDLVQVDYQNGFKVYENLIIGNHYYFFVKDVLENSISCPVLLSRTNPEIVKFLMQKHIPEMEEGLIEVKGMARIAGTKTKIFVSSNKKNLDPVGCCIGPKGRRLKIVSNQLLNEKIDVILWHDDPVKNVINAFVPGKILGYRIDGEMEITLIATLENLLSAIGKKGVNAKLVYILTGWKTILKTIQEAKDEKIEYIAVDNYKNTNSENVSNRIFEMHYMKNEEALSRFHNKRKENTTNAKVNVDDPKR